MISELAIFSFRFNAALRDTFSFYLQGLCVLPANPRPRLLLFYHTGPGRGTNVAHLYPHGRPHLAFFPSPLPPPVRKSSLN